MKLKKAIEINTNYLRGDEPDHSPDLPDAIRLGIEALKAVKESRRLWGDRGVSRLPGETEE